MTEKPTVDRIEEAPSNRARCRACGVAIDKGELRFGEVVVAGHDFIAWYHLACAQARTPERFAPVLAASKLAAAKLPPPPDAGLGRLISVERSTTGRATCQACRGGIGPLSLRVAVRLDPDPANPEFARKGFIHLACAHTFANGADVAPYLTKRATKLAKSDRAAVAAVLAAVHFLATDSRARRLVTQAREETSHSPMRRSGAKAPATPTAAQVVVADWLEETHGIVLEPYDLLRVLATSVQLDPHLPRRTSNKPR